MAVAQSLSLLSRLGVGRRDEGKELNLLRTRDGRQSLASLRLRQIALGISLTELKLS